VLSIFLKRTLTGKSMLATADNTLAARLVGIDTSRMIEISFAVSATIGAIGGILATPIALTSYSAGTFLALKGFVAAMLGGMGSPLGAVVGGLLLGLIEQFGAGYLSSQYKDAIAVVVLLLVLFTRPSGLFGKPGAERV
jgi:branched-chain amino acid transport system permease protein